MKEFTLQESILFSVATSGGCLPASHAVLCDNCLLKNVCEDLDEYNETRRREEARRLLLVRLSAEDLMDVLI